MKESFPKEKQQGGCIPQARKFVQKSPWDSIDVEKQVNSPSTDAKSQNYSLHQQHGHHRSHSREMK